MLSQFSDERVIADTNDDAADEVENGNDPGFAFGDLQPHRYPPDLPPVRMKNANTEETSGRERSP